MAEPGIFKKTSFSALATAAMIFAFPAHATECAGRDCKDQSGSAVQSAAIGTAAAAAAGALALGLQAHFSSPRGPTCRSIFKPHLFGLEFTFTNQALIDEGLKSGNNPHFYGNPLKSGKWQEMVDRIKAECVRTQECKPIEGGRDKHDKMMKFLFNDGYYFTVGVDNLVIEVNAYPKPNGGFNTERVQHYVFDLAKSVGLEPHEHFGGGHIHVSRSVFEEDPMMFRNFIVDLQNRPELIIGAFGEDLGNAPPLSALKAHQRDEFERIMKLFNPRWHDINDLVDGINKLVYTETWEKNSDGPDYYQALNFGRMGKVDEYATLEFRFFRPQESAKVFELQTTLIDRWIKSMHGRKRPIKYLKKDRYRFEPQEIVDSFAQLIGDLDLPYEEYRILLPKKLREITPSPHARTVPYSLKSYWSSIGRYINPASQQDN